LSLQHYCCCQKFKFFILPEAKLQIGALGKMVNRNLSNASAARNKSGRDGNANTRKQQSGGPADENVASSNSRHKPRISKPQDVGLESHNQDVPPRDEAEESGDNSEPSQSSNSNTRQGQNIARDSSNDDNAGPVAQSVPSRNASGVSNVQPEPIVVSRQGEEARSGGASLHAQRLRFPQPLLNQGPVAPEVSRLSQQSANVPHSNQRHTGQSIVQALNNLQNSVARMEQTMNARSNDGPHIWMSQRRALLPRVKRLIANVPALSVSIWRSQKVTDF
jgi:hypothetical protein